MTDYCLKPLSFLKGLSFTLPVVSAAILMLLPAGLALLVGSGPTLGTREQAPSGQALTAREAVSEALRTHPLVRAAEQRLRGGEARLRGARAPLNPELILQHGAGNGTGGLDEDISVSQIFELGGKRRFRGQQAGGELKKNAAELEAVRIEVAHQALGAYLDVQEAIVLQEQAAEFLRLAAQFRTTAAALLMAGEIPRTQLIRSEIEVAARQQVLDEAETELETRMTALNSALGRPLGAPLRLADALPESVAAPEPLDRWKERAAARPEVQVARADLAARRAGLAVARSEFAPNLFLTGVHARFDQGPGNSVRAGLTLPLLDRGLLRARRDEARAAIAASEADVDDALRKASLEVETAFNRLTRASDRLQRYRSGQLEQARTLAGLAQIGYEAGHTSYLELLDAQKAFHETRSGYLKVLAEVARARLALERAAGGGFYSPP